MAVSSTVKVKNRKSKVKALGVYKWRGLNRKGKKINGELNATSILELKAQLRKQGITPGKISKKAKPLFGLGGDKKNYAG
jgi:type IV pilus assembly protein PilC